MASGRAAASLKTESISRDEARRLALAAQGFDAQRPARVEARHLRRTIDRIGLLQLDSVNAVCRSHYLPLFARLGPYPRATLDRMAWGPARGRQLFEYWGHAASLLPTDTLPWLRWRMRAARRWRWEGWTSTRQPGRPPADYATSWDADISAPWAVVEGMTRLTVERPELLAEVRDLVTRHGPLAAAAANADGDRRRGSAEEGGRMWNWQDAKIALEWLFCTGTVTTARTPDFERLYDLTERMLPARVLDRPEPSRHDAQRELVRIAARASGVATERELRGYFRLARSDAVQRIAELVESGELVPTRIDGVSQRHYRWAAARASRPIAARALLSPFDSLVWDRDRIQRLFEFHYRISLYTPAAQRTHGYYVLPFLLGERLVGRVDLKADRAGSVLRVEGAFAEPGTEPGEVSAALAEELALLAGWLELDRVVVAGRGDLARPLASALGSAPA